MGIFSTEKNLLDGVFDKFLVGRRIFRSREVLRHDFIPNHLPHRDEQIESVGEVVAPFLKESRGSNLFVYGKTGTGKTAVVRYVLNHLTSKSREIGASVKTSYVNCRLMGTNYRVLAKIGQAVDADVPFTGLATQEVFERFKRGIDARRQSLVVVLDEVDALVKTCGDALLYDLTRANENLSLSQIGLIGISNDLGFKDFLDPRVLSSLSEEELVFRPYTAPELLDILRERADIGFNYGVLGDGALGLCSALAAAEHGDARRALDLLRVAGELAEREGSSKMVEDHVKKAQEKIEEDRLSVILRTLPSHSKLVLCSVFLFRGQKNGSTTGDVYEVYTELCHRSSIEPLTQRRVSGLVNELDVVGILSARVVSMGRYGRTKKVGLGIPRSVISLVYSEDEYIADLLKFEPKCLAK